MADFLLETRRVHRKFGELSHEIVFFLFYGETA